MLNLDSHRGVSKSESGVVVAAIGTGLMRGNSYRAAGRSSHGEYLSERTSVSSKKGSDVVAPEQFRTQTPFQQTKIELEASQDAARKHASEFR